jgi:hypothetical protein
VPAPVLDTGQLWEQSLPEPTHLAPRFRVVVLGELLAPQREVTFKIRSQIAPRIGHQKRERVRTELEAGR